jgi:hypothetical protein
LFNAFTFATVDATGTVTTAFATTTDNLQSQMSEQQQLQSESTTDVLNPCDSSDAVTAAPTSFTPTALSATIGAYGSDVEMGHYSTIATVATADLDTVILGTFDSTASVTTDTTTTTAVVDVAHHPPPPVSLLPFDLLKTQLTVTDFTTVFDTLSQPESTVQAILQSLIYSCLKDSIDINDRKAIPNEFCKQIQLIKSTEYPLMTPKLIKDAIKHRQVLVIQSNQTMINKAVDLWHCIQVEFNNLHNAPTVRQYRDQQELYTGPKPTDQLRLEYFKHDDCFALKSTQSITYKQIASLLTKCDTYASTFPPSTSSSSSPPPSPPAPAPAAAAPPPPPPPPRLLSPRGILSDDDVVVVQKEFIYLRDVQTTSADPYLSDLIAHHLYLQDLYEYAKCNKSSITSLYLGDGLTATNLHKDKANTIAVNQIIHSSSDYIKVWFINEQSTLTSHLHTCPETTVSYLSFTVSLND